MKPKIDGAEFTATKPSKPHAQLAHLDSKDESLFGCMKGLAKIHGDLTKPIDVDWKVLK